MEQFTIRELYTLEETIAADLFEGAVYPWELLPKISAFIVELGEKLPKDRYTEVKEHVWVANNATVAPSALSMDRPLLMRRQRFVTVHSSVEMPSLERVLLSEIRPSLKMLFSLIRYRCLIIIMSVTVSWDSRHIWVPALLPPM